MEEVSSLEGGVSVVVTVPGGEIVECSFVVQRDADDDDEDEKALVLPDERAKSVAKTEDFILFCLLSCRQQLKCWSSSILLRYF